MANFFGELSEAEKKTLITWSIGGIVVFIIAIIFKFTVLDKDPNKNKNVTFDTEYHVVENYSRYYTVTGALEKYYSFINAEDSEALMNILSSNYKNTKKINRDNVLDYIDSSDIQVSFEPSKMCEMNYAVGRTKYLLRVTEVPVFLQEGDDYTEIQDNSLGEVYYLVELDGNTLTYSVEPITKKTYEEGCHEEE